MGPTGSVVCYRITYNLLSTTVASILNFMEITKMYVIGTNIIKIHFVVSAAVFIRRIFFKIFPALTKIYGVRTLDSLYNFVNSSQFSYAHQFST